MHIQYNGGKVKAICWYKNSSELYIYYVIQVEVDVPMILMENMNGNNNLILLGKYGESIIQKSS
jgi:hypothetical protein